MYPHYATTQRNTSKVNFEKFFKFQEHLIHENDENELILLNDEENKEQNRFPSTKKLIAQLALLQPGNITTNNIL